MDIRGGQDGQWFPTGYNPVEEAAAGRPSSGGNWGSTATATASALAQAFSSYMGSKASSEATKAAAASNLNALQFEREREASRQKRYQDAMRMNEKRWAAYDARRNALLQRYGIDIGPADGGGGGEAPPEG